MLKNTSTESLNKVIDKLVHVLDSFANSNRGNERHQLHNTLQEFAQEIIKLGKVESK